MADDTLSTALVSSGTLPPSLKRSTSVVPDFVALPPIGLGLMLGSRNVFGTACDQRHISHCTRGETSARRRRLRWSRACSAHHVPAARQQRHRATTGTRLKLEA